MKLEIYYIKLKRFDIIFNKHYHLQDFGIDSWVPASNGLGDRSYQ